MTVPTHVAVALVAGLITGADTKTAFALTSVGSLLPDIDHPRSIVGKLLFPISYPLNRWVGHRTLTHSILLWIPALIAGSFWLKPLMWLAIGAMSHVLIDCVNLSGVPLLWPTTEKIFVMASKKFRIASGSRGEFGIMLLVLLIAWGCFYVKGKGGIRPMFHELIGSYDMARSHLEKQGRTLCRIGGKLRFSDGRIQEGEWLVVGIYGATGMVIYDGNGTIQIPDKAEFLRAVLRPQKGKAWNGLTMGDISRVRVESGLVFCRADKHWTQVRTGELVYGSLIYDGEITLEKEKVK